MLLRPWNLTINQKAKRIDRIGFLSRAECVNLFFFCFFKAAENKGLKIAGREKCALVSFSSIPCGSPSCFFWNPFPRWKRFSIIWVPFYAQLQSNYKFETALSREKTTDISFVNSNIAKESDVPSQMRAQFTVPPQNLRY